MHLWASCHRAGLNPSPMVGKGRGEGSSNHPPGDGHTGLAGPAFPGLASTCWLAAASASTGEACRE